MHKEAREGSSLPRNDLPDVSPPLDQSSQVASITTADKAKAEAYCMSKGKAPASETAVRQSRHKTRPSSPPNGRPISFATENPRRLLRRPTSWWTPKQLPRLARRPTTRRSLRPPQASIPTMPSGISTRWGSCRRTMTRTSLWTI
jgi:hypothetical protein